MDDWRIAVELALRLGADLDLATVDEVTDALSNVAPAFAGASAVLFKHARDGVVLPVREHAGEIVLRSRGMSILAEDGQGTSWDPIKVEGQAPADSTNAVEASGAGAEPLAPGAGELETPAAVVTDAVAAATRAAATVLTPELFVWKTAAPSRETAARDAYALRLVVGRALYDRGRIVTETPILARLSQHHRLRVNPADLARIGVEPGGQVKVTSARGSQTVGVETDPSVPAGIAAFDFTADGLGPSQLIDAAQPVTDLRLESIR
jgi:anaerobic selenocysteine-containing dehydrogenase